MFYYLTPASRERVVAAFPGTELLAASTVPIGVQQDGLRDKGDGWWMELACALTGRSDEEIDSLGGVRIFVAGTIAFERIPAAASRR